MNTRHLGDHLVALTAQVQEISSQKTPLHIARSLKSLDNQHRTYQLSKSRICDSAHTVVNRVVLDDGSVTDLLSNPIHGTVFADNRVEQRYVLYLQRLNRVISFLLGPTPSTLLLQKN